MPRPTLSISSMSTRGFSVPTRLSACIILLGSALKQYISVLVVLSDSLNGLPHIGSSMPLDLGHIRQTANRESEELSVQRTRDGLSYARLPNTWWTNETDDLTLDGAAELAHSEKLEDAVFDVRESVVILVEDFDGVLDGKVFF